MAGIIAALVTGNEIGIVGKEIDDLAFAFVTPLASDNHNQRHFRAPLGSMVRRADKAQRQAPSPPPRFSKSAHLYPLRKV
jgi:hypothetical protein